MRWERVASILITPNHSGILSSKPSSCCALFHWDAMWREFLSSFKVFQFSGKSWESWVRGSSWGLTLILIPVRLSSHGATKHHRFASEKWSYLSSQRRTTRSRLLALVVLWINLLAHSIVPLTRSIPQQHFLVQSIQLVEFLWRISEIFGLCRRTSCCCLSHFSWAGRGRYIIQ